MADGYNPMRWDCHKGGRGENCFNKKRRPKIEVFADCFPRKINFGDVDGWVEMSGAICALEWKGDGGVVHIGQRRSFVGFTNQDKRNVVFVVQGDAETMEVEGYSIFWKGRSRPFVKSSLHEVKARMKAWADWVETKQKQKKRPHGRSIDGGARALRVSNRGVRP